MKRRDLIKTGLATLGASTIALSGCSKSETSFDIIPKQTATYEFSAPLPFNYKTIDEMTEFNTTIKKSQIKILYNNIPRPLVDKYNYYIHTVKGKENSSIKTLEDFGQYVKYALDKGFDFTYLMNSPKIFSDSDFIAFKDDFLKLLEYLHKIGVKNIKVGSNQIIDLINQYAPDEFNLQVSTCFEINNISQYKNLFDIYPNFNFITFPKDENQNFRLIKNLKKLYPDKKIEFMLGKYCTKGCSAKSAHFQRSFSEPDCEKLRKKMGFLNYFIKSGSIFPWDMKYYSAMGINNFKYIAGPPNRSDYRDIEPFKKLLNIIENGYENYNWQDMKDTTIWVPPVMINDKNKNIKLSEIAPLFPNMKYFIKHGHECSSMCEAECNYCFDCAKKLAKVLYLT